MDTYQKAKIFSVSRIPTPGIVTIAVNAIPAALLHGVVIDKEDFRKQLKDAESRLGECEEKNRELKKHNEELQRKIRELNQKK